MKDPEEEGGSIFSGKSSKRGDRKKMSTLSSALDVLETAIWVFDIEKKAMLWSNKSGCDLWGAKNVEELLARKYTDMSESTSRRLNGYMTRFIQDEKICSEMWTFYPKGRAITCKMTSSGIYTDDNRLVMLCEAVPISADETDSTALRSIESLRHLPIAVEQMTPQGIIMQQNPTAMAIFGDSLSADGEEDSVKPKAVQYFEDRFVDKEQGHQFLSELRNGPPRHHTCIEALLSTVDKSELWFIVEGRCGFDPITSEAIVLTNFRDINKRKVAEIHLREAKNQAERTRQSQDEFYGVITHELRTPLNGILGFADLLSETMLNTTQKEFLSTLQSSAVSLVSIVNDLLDFSKLQSGSTVLETLDFQLDGVIESALTVICPEAKKKHLEFIRLNTIRHMSLIGDSIKLRQILLNTLNNAVKYTDQGTITLSVSCVTETSSPNEMRLDQNRNKVRLRFEVTDTGIGIAPEDIEKLFCEFKKGNTVAKRFGGVGLGLTISKKLVTLMGGEIGVQSEVGRGSCFWFELPFIQNVHHHCNAPLKTTISPPTAQNMRQLPEPIFTAQESSSQRTTMISPPVSPPKDTLIAQPVHTAPSTQIQPSLRVLVAEDLTVNQKLVKVVLSKMGHQAYMVENGLLAVEALQRDRNFDLVLMDKTMPILDGIAATKRIRELGFTKNDLPIIGITADYRPDEMDIYLDAGMNTCISKPCRLHTLRQAIQDHTNHSNPSQNIK